MCLKRGSPEHHPHCSSGTSGSRRRGGPPHLTRRQERLTDIRVGQTSGQGQTRQTEQSAPLWTAASAPRSAGELRADRPLDEPRRRGRSRGGCSGTHRGRRFPSRHDADQREVLGLVTAEGGRGVSGHHLDGGGRSYPKRSTGRARLHWKVQKEFSDDLGRARSSARCGEKCEREGRSVASDSL